MQLEDHLPTITHSSVSNCPGCGADLPLESLACPQCHTLIYARELDTLAREARAFEAASEYSQARELWARSLTRLPHDSKQADWVREHLRALETMQPGALEAQPGQPAKAPHPNWVKRLGPLGPFALLLFKLKGLLFALFKLKFLFSFLIFIWLYVTLFGWPYGVGISVSILIHEMGHYIDVRRRGLKAELPMFIPGFGASVRWMGQGITLAQRAQIALAGPLAGWIAAACCFLLYPYTGAPVWAALARTGAILNILNLIPIWILDGGKAISSLTALERAALLATTLGLWAYTGESIFLFVSAGIAWRIYTYFRHQDDKPQRSDWGTWMYYAALLAALGILLHATPNTIAREGLEYSRGASIYHSR
jgi:Zn-dependent protease